ncbi:MAG: helix-turn-helix transcriptional regulator [Casimicrobiaceae bacterium]
MTDRTAFPDITERAQRLGDLIAAPALPLVDVALMLDLPLVTLDRLRATGRGPRSFRIGSRLYVRQTDLRVWLDQLAAKDEA